MLARLRSILMVRPFEASGSSTLMNRAWFRMGGVQAKRQRLAFLARNYIP
jgi:hypothetical protein